MSRGSGRAKIILDEEQRKRLKRFSNLDLLPSEKLREHVVYGVTLGECPFQG